MSRLSIESKKIRMIVAILPLFAALLYPDASVGGDNVAVRVQKLKEQYQSINTVYIKSQIVMKVYIGLAEDPPSDKLKIRRNHYEYWANKDGHYRVNSFFYDSNGMPEDAWEFSYDGSLFQIFDKRALLFSYGREDPEQNPCAPENPLFAPLWFLGRNDDNCLACALKLKAVIKADTWEEKLNSSKVIAVSDQKPSQIVMETPKGVVEGRKAVSRIYFGDVTDYLPSKINVVDTEGNIITSTEITAYKAIGLNGKQTYWPKSIHFSGKDAKGNILVEMDAEVEVCQINEGLPPDIFTIDFSSARAVWDDDAKKFVE
ncbi:MAG: hypothetical protein JW947_00590 [Sedimentisphaerales bacterium]|nr:hypothetical protein [Sedimentisphaerales bacterium]